MSASGRKNKMTFTLDEILAWTEGELLASGENKRFSSIFSDSRKIIADGLFVAFKGERFDGNRFVADTLQKGAAAALVSEKITPVPGKTLIYVPDTLAAYQKIANGYRNRLKLKLAAVTGSVGKTTTKEVLGQCLMQAYNTKITTANHNNDIGVPETLFSFDERTEAAVVEMGMRGRGEIERLCRTAEPDFAVITNIAPVHLEFLGSMENIAAAKAEIFSYLKPEGKALVNAEDPRLLKAAAAYQRPFYTFGKDASCDCQLKNLEMTAEGMHMTFKLFDYSGTFFFPIASEALALDVLAAAGCAFLMGVKPEQIDFALRNFVGKDNRLHREDLPEGGFIINDSYNANPASMAAALEFLKLQAKGQRKIAVLGDMYELGSFEEEGHRQTGAKACTSGTDILVTIGEIAEAIAAGFLAAGGEKDAVVSFPDSEAALPWLLQNVKPTDAVLFKASHGRRLDLLLEQWKQGINEGEISHD